MAHKDLPGRFYEVLRGYVIHGTDVKLRIVDGRQLDGKIVKLLIDACVLQPNDGSFDRMILIENIVETVPAQPD